MTLNTLKTGAILMPTQLVLGSPCEQPKIDAVALAMGPCLWLIDCLHHRLRHTTGRFNKLGQGLIELLSTSERERLETLFQTRHQDRFLLAHASLRLLLAGILGCSPHVVAFARGPYGKPMLAQPIAALGAVQFNLSYAGDYVLIGLHSHSCIGVDIAETLMGADFGLDSLALAKLWFSPVVVQQLSCLPVQRRAPLFFQHWCRLEAELKASGSGFRLDLPFPLPLDPLLGLGVYAVKVPQGYCSCCVIRY